MTPEEFARARRLIQRIAVARPRRRSRRLRRDPRGTVLDVRGLARTSLATGGDPVVRTFRSRTRSAAQAGPDPRRLGLDGVVRAGAAPLPARRARLGPRRRDVRLRHEAYPAHPELGTRDPDAALTAAAERVVDWSGGTRIGLSLKAFNDEWGRRALTRGAVVVILSDGCERGDPALVAHEMARLARQAFAVVWVNPLKGDPEFQPLAGACGRRCPTSTGSWQGTTSRASRRWVSPRRGSNGGTQHEGDRRRDRALAAARRADCRSRPSSRPATPRPPGRLEVRGLGGRPDLRLGLGRLRRERRLRAGKRCSRPARRSS